MNQRPTHSNWNHLNPFPPSEVSIASAGMPSPDLKPTEISLEQSTIDSRLTIVNPDITVLEALSLMSENARSDQSKTIPRGEPFTSETPTSKNRVNLTLKPQLLKDKKQLDRQIGYALIMQDEKIQGLFTSDDLITLLKTGTDLKTVKISEVMQPPIAVLSESKLQRFFKTFSIFSHYWLRHLPVVNDRGQVVGLLTPDRVHRLLKTILGFTPDVSTHGLRSSETIPPAWLSREFSPLFPVTPDQDPLSDSHTSQPSRPQNRPENRNHQHGQDGASPDPVHPVQQSLDWLTQGLKTLGTLSCIPQQPSDLRHLLQLNTAEISRLFRADRVCIYRFHPDWQSSVIAETVVPEFPSILGFQIHDQVVSGQDWLNQYQQGRACVIDDVSSLKFEPMGEANFPQESAIERSTERLLRFFQVQAKIVAPILQGNKLWGLLAVHQCSAPRRWAAMEIQLLKQFAVQLGTAIAQLERQQQIQKLEKSLSIQAQEHSTRLTQALDFEAMLTLITDRVRDSLDEHQILQIAVQELTMVLGLGGCQAVLCDMERSDTCNVTHEYVAFPPPASDDRFHAFDDFPELCEQLHRGTQSQFCLYQPFLNSGKHAILLSPIFDDQGYLGNLRLYSHRRHCFKEQEKRLVHQVASHCAIAIRQARLFQASQAQVKELERLNQLKDDFLSTVSHELRTPLSSIKMVTNLLKLALNPEKRQCMDHPLAACPADKVTQYLKVLEEECDREITLINDLLTTQHLNAGSHPLSLAPIHLEDWILHVIETFHHQVNLQQQTLRVDIAKNLPPLVSDSFMLNRILVELLNNACKYTPAGEQILVAIAAQPHGIQLLVSNSGVEIPSPELPHIFDPFYRIPNDDPWKRGGTGLGLSLTKKLVEYLGGTIRAESRSRNVRFIVDLPFRDLVKD